MQAYPSSASFRSLHITSFLTEALECSRRLFRDGNATETLALVGNIDPLSLLSGSFNPPDKLIASLTGR